MLYLLKRIRRSTLPFAILLLPPTAASAGLSLEPLHSAAIVGNELHLEVTGNGCTQLEHFHVLQKVDPQKGTQLSIYRAKPDNCRKAPAIKQIRMNLSREGIELEKGIQLMNDFVAFRPMTRQ